MSSAQDAGAARASDPLSSSSPSSETPRKTLRRNLLVLLLAGTYISLFWFHPPAGWPQWLGAPRSALISFFARSLSISRPWAWTLMSVLLGGLLPTLFLLVWRRSGDRHHPVFLRTGRPLAWFYVVIAYLIALGPLLWLASRPGFRHYYASSIQQGLGPMSLRFALVLIAEHIAIQGLVLVLALPSPAYWPQAPAPVVGSRWSARLRRRLGLGPDWSLRSLELNGAVLLAIGAQALIFGWVHFSKDLGELLTSFPGGFALGYLAWRGRSVWPCVALHAATGLTVILLTLLW